MTEDIIGTSYHWVEKPSKVFPRLHLRGIKLLGGVLNTKTRAFKGRGINLKDTKCRGACRLSGARETLRLLSH